MTRYALLAALAALSASLAWGAWQMNRAQRLSAENAILKAYADTVERISNAPPIDFNDTCAVARELHRLSGQRPGDLHCDENGPQ